MFQNICMPAMIYFILAIISIIYSFLNKVSITVTIIHLIFALLWSGFLAWLCSKGFSLLSWFLLLLPFILIILFLFVFVEYLDKLKGSGS